MSRGDAGFTIVELLVAVCILLLVTTALTAALHDNLLRTPMLEESSDLQQRTRIVADTLAADFRAIGTGSEAGRLPAFFAAVVPRTASAPATATVQTAVTVRFVPADGARSRLSVPLLPADGAALLDPNGACVRNAVACGFTAATMAVVFDEAGQADIVSVDAIAPGALAISDPAGSRTAAYPAGTWIAELVEITYRFDAAARQLRRDWGGGSFPVAENVEQVTFSYFGSTEPPSAPRPPLGTANCLYRADGSRLPYAPGNGSGAVEALPLAGFGDGPFCGSGRLMFDADLLKVRAVRAVVRLDTSVDTLRGSDPRLFARPGTASGAHVLPDSVVSIDVAVRNPGR